jgi:hypothetical protein
VTVVNRSAPVQRTAWGLIAVVLAAGVATAYATGSPGWWQLAAFGLGPDLAFVLSIDPDLERGRMSPRAVPLYNLLHRPVLPAALGALVLAGIVPAALAAGALVWGFHIAFDRFVGYGLRTRDGRQR